MAPFKKQPCNAEVLRRELLRKKAIRPSHRTVDRVVAQLQMKMHSDALAMVHIETLQIKPLDRILGSLR